MFGGVGWIGGSILGTVGWLFSQIEAAVALAGPLAPLVWAILAAIVVVATYRTVKALLTLVNLDSLLQLVN